MVLVRACLMGAYCEGGVEQENPLTGPPCQLPTGVGDMRVEVGIDFLDDVDQRGRDSDPLGDRKAETLRLSRLVVGVLSEDDDFHLVERRVVEGGKDLAAGRVTDILLAFRYKKTLQLCEIGCLELRSEDFKPGGVNLYQLWVE